MCNFYEISKSKKELEVRYKATFKEPALFKPGYLNGFTHSFNPVITNDNPDEIQLFSWGLIPFWSKDRAIQKSTLNARIETIKEKPSFRNSVDKRCLIPATSFYEWQWLDEKGKMKQKYMIRLEAQDVFSFGGLWSSWTDKESGEIVNTYTILTMDANPLMAEIHNTKKRMPVIVSFSDEQNWLNGGELKLMNDDLFATKI